MRQAWRVSFSWKGPVNRSAEVTVVGGFSQIEAALEKVHRPRGYEAHGQLDHSIVIHSVEQLPNAVLAVE